MAREMSNDSANTVRRMTICGTNEYMSPELLFDEEYSNSVDVFSFGMVLLEVMKRQQVGKRGDKCFAARYPQNSFTLDVEAVQAALPPDAPPSLVMLALQCCEYDVADRPFSDDVYDWLQDLGESFEGSTETLPSMPPIPDELRDTSSTAGASEAGAGAEMEKQSVESQQCAESVRILHSLVEIQSPDTILKAGIIHKKNRSGFRNWKERFLILTPYQIRWYLSSDDLTCEKGHIDLINARVARTKHHR
jgi:serine/threonine protein kinase